MVSSKSEFRNDSLKVKTPKIITISELLQCSTPHSGAASLHLLPVRVPHAPSIGSDFLSSSTYTHSTSRPNANTKLLVPLSHSSVIIGSLSLPSHDYSPSTFNHGFSSCDKHCLSFSDGFSSICCDVLDLDLQMINTKINVIAWNFIPFECGGGFLEIITWSFPESTSGLAHSNFSSVPLASNSSFAYNGSPKARYCVHGVLESISPVSVVTCLTDVSDSEGCSHVPKNILGFLAQIKACNCRLCRSKDSSTDLSEYIGKPNIHSFTNSLFVYFCDSASCWNPVISKLLGKVVFLSGLKKKLVHMRNQSSILMYIITRKSLLHMWRKSGRCFQFKKTTIQGKGECANYIGIVKGIYMDGMVVELDEDVWLLLKNQLSIAPHSLRVGAFLSVKNVHFVNPKFLWSKILILGACSKTSFDVESYSPVETRCHMVSQSQSLLEKFITSHSFSAQFWVLVTVASLKMKLDGILSDKEVIGSKHKEGFALNYANSYLYSSACESQGGAFMEFCNHDSYGCCGESNYGELKLAVPISDILYHCMDVWIKLQYQKCDILRHNGQCSLWFCNRQSYSQSIRRIFRSDEIGFALLGCLKFSPGTGKLQLADATGSIDVVIPGLPSVWDLNGLYEVKDYSVVMEGLPENILCFEMCDHESFSCRGIFQCLKTSRDLNVRAYVYFNWNRIVCKNYPFHCCNFKELENGTYHILYVTHKHQVPPKIHAVENLNRSTMFVEVVLLPWNLVVSRKDSGISKVEQDHVPYKRHKTNFEIGEQLGSSFDRDLAFCSSNMNEIACLVRSGHDGNIFSSGTLYFTKSNRMVGIPVQKGLLEFDSKCFYKYQILEIGRYYISKHQTEEKLCKSSSSDFLINCKVHINSKIHFWSVSFNSDFSDLVDDNSINDSCISKDSFIRGHTFQIELPFKMSSADRSVPFSDFCVELAAGADQFILNIKKATEGLIKPYVSQCGKNQQTFTMPSFGRTDADCLLPMGNLISLHGIVVNVHAPGFSSVDVLLSHETDAEVNHWRHFHQFKTNICIHVVVDHHIVKISGAFRKTMFPVGFGASVTATFYQILDSGVQNELVLTPMSFIVVNSLIKVNHLCCAKFSDLGYTSKLGHIVSHDPISSCLISDFFECSKTEPVQFRCRVVSVYVLVLEKSRKCDGPLWGTHSRSPVNASLAGFILDDGSGSCCCWVNTECALMLLGSSASNHDLSNIFEKHGRIIVKNHGFIYDSSCQDLTFSVDSDVALDCSEERCLKTIIQNACCATIWNVNGGVLDSNDLAKLENRLAGMRIGMPGLLNIWAAHLHHANPLTEARLMIQQLLKSLVQE